MQTLVLKPLDPILDRDVCSCRLGPEALSELLSLGIYFVLELAMMPPARARSTLSAKIVAEFHSLMVWTVNFGSVALELSPNFKFDYTDPSVASPELALYIRLCLRKIVGDYVEEVDLGKPSYVALALINEPEFLTPLVQEELDVILARFGLRSNMTPQEIVDLAPALGEKVTARVHNRFPQLAVPLTDEQVTLLASSMSSLDIEQLLITWVVERVSVMTPSVVDGLVTVLAVHDPPPALVKWLIDHGIPLQQLSSADLRQIAMFRE